MRGHKVGVGGLSDEGSQRGGGREGSQMKGHKSQRGGGREGSQIVL